MPDYSIYIRINNTTGDVLRWLDSPAVHGQWINIPGRIEPRSTSEIFQLKDPLGPIGSEGHLQFEIQRGPPDNMPRSYLSARLSCPYFFGRRRNKVEVQLIVPEELYAASFRASSGKGHQWTEGRIDGKGHPLHVEVMLERTKFTVERICATVGHPIVNSRNVMGKRFNVQELWNQSTWNDSMDGQRGSFQPNIFGYDLLSDLSRTSALTVTIAVRDPDLIGAQGQIHGRAPGSGVTLQSNVFSIGSLSNVAISVHVAEPAACSKPFALNADVEWKITTFRGRRSGSSDDWFQPKKTRLELYWIAETLHPAFESGGIPVEFLRIMLPLTSRSNFDNFDSYDWNREMTRRAFEDYNKTYDTCSGTAHFGVRLHGGIFDLRSYFEADKSGKPGTLYRLVNCMDQAAIVELTCSLGRGASDPPMSWVAHEPFGYIKDTHLVGVSDHDGDLLAINNPYFGADQTRCHLDPQDPTRTFFVCHAYQIVGHNLTNLAGGAFNRHVVYDACSGPHLGTESISDYLTRSIDTSQTETVDSGRPVTHLGVTCINQQHRMPPLDSYTDSSNKVLTLVGLPEAGTASSSITYVHWAHLPEWIKKVLGEDWRANGSGYVSVTEATTHASWWLERKRAKKSAYEPAIKIDVYVQSHTDADGVLDLAASKQATRRCLASIITSTSRVITEVWTRGKLDEFGECSVQYIRGGRFIVVAGPTIIDIQGERTVKLFEPCALKLLEHTIRRDSPALTAPVIRRGPLLSMQNRDEELPSKILVHSVDQRFSLDFQLDKPIAAANATTEGWAFLFDKYVQEVAENSVTVRLMFMVQKMGSHVVKVHFADSETLVSRTQTVEVEVVE